MGAFLTQPNTNKTIHKEENQQFTICSASMQGWRQYMEDDCLIVQNLKENIHLFAVFDGHGGSQIVQFVKNHFIEELKQNQNFIDGNYDLALEETFMQMDEMIASNRHQEEIKIYRQALQETKIEKKKEGEFVGCATIVCLIAKKAIYVANSGDSKALLLRKNEVIEMSSDHVPYQDSEALRIINAGGFIDKNGRLNGTLAMSRAIGDLEFKDNQNLQKNEQILISFPEVRKFAIKPEDNFILIATDGLFDLMTSDQVMDFCKQRISQKTQLEQILSDLFDNSIATDTKTGYGCDNMTTILIVFK